MRIVFMGTPQFAIPILNSLMQNHTVIAVISQPDRAKDRQGRLIATPVKSFAEKNDIPVLQFEKIKQHCAELKALNADLYVTAAYGQILSQEIIDIPKYGIINVHASLLPKFRGSSPIQSAILSGEKATGVTIMQTSLGMDTGDILLSRKVEIGTKNYDELSELLSNIGAELIIEAIKKIESGKIQRIRQDDDKATYCKKIDKSSAMLDFNLPAEKLSNVVRAFANNPVAFTFFRGERVKIYSCCVTECCGQAGSVVFADKNHGLVVACGEGGIRLEKIQFPGKKIMTDIELLNGKKIEIGEHFG